MNKFFNRLGIIIVFSGAYILCPILSFWWTYRLFKRNRKRDAANFSRNGFFGVIGLIALSGIWIAHFPWNEWSLLLWAVIQFFVYWDLHRLIKNETCRANKIYFDKLRGELQKEMG
jgi:hypothetical protein